MEGTENPESAGDNSPISFTSLGIPVYPRFQTGITGQVRTLASIRRNEWLYLALSYVSLLSSLILTIQKMASLDPTSDDFTFAILLIFTIVFCSWYVIHGILKERPYEIFVFVAGTCVVMIYSVLNFAFGKKDLTKSIRLGFAFVLGPLVIAGGLWLSKFYYESNDFIIRTLGSTKEAMSMGRRLFLCTSLLKFDLQLGGSMIILIMTNGTNVSRTETILLSIGAITFVLWALLGYIAIRLENKILVSVFLTFSILSPALIVYKLYTLYEENSEVLRACIISCAVLGLIIRLATVICMVLVMLNFDRGIKEKLYSRVTQKRSYDAASKTSSPHQQGSQE